MSDPEKSPKTVAGTSPGIAQSAGLLLGFFLVGLSISLVSGYNPYHDLGGVPNSYGTRYFWEFWNFNHELVTYLRIPVKIMGIEYPIGGTSIPLAPIPSAGFALLSLAISGVISFNCIVIAQLAVTAFAGYLLGLRLLQRRLLALVVAGILAYSPWMLTIGLATGEFTTVSAGWGLLSLLFLWDSMAEKSYRKAFYAAILFTVQFYTAPANAVFTFVMSPFIVAINLFYARTGVGVRASYEGLELGQRMSKSLLYLLLASAVAAPYWVILASMTRDPVSFLYQTGYTLTPEVARPDHEYEQYRDPTFVSVSEFFRPFRYDLATINMGWNHRRYVFPGFIIWVLVVLGIITSRPARLWVVVTGGAVFACSGPYLSLTPELWSVRRLSPIYWVLSWFADLGLVVQPIRFCTVVMIGIAFMAAAGVAAVVEKRQFKNLIGALLLTLILGESVFHALPLVRGAYTPVIPLPSAQSWVSQSCQGEGVVTVPIFAYGTAIYSNQALLLQTQHQRPILNPCLAKLTGRYFRNEFLKLLLAMELPELIQIPIPNPQSAEVQDGIDSLVREGICYLIVNPALYRESVDVLLTQVLEQQVGPPDDLGNGLLLYRLSARSQSR